MSRQIGYFADDAVRDFPELNKCPDCETFFADDCCPLCGKACPEEYRSGNRKPIKQKKRRHTSNGRVQFIPWYHSAAFVITMLLVQPLIGIVLTWTSHWKKVWKVVATVGGIFGAGWLAILLGFLTLMLGFGDPAYPVDSMSRADYIEYCEVVSPETLYARSDEYYWCDVAVDVTVKEALTARREYEEQGSLTYYLCEARVGEDFYEFYLRDCRIDATDTLIVGDFITAYGVVVYDNVLHLSDGGTRYGVFLEIYYTVPQVETQ